MAREKEVIAIFKKRADDLGEKHKDVPAALAADTAAATKKLETLKLANEARAKPLAGMPRRPRPMV